MLRTTRVLPVAATLAFGAAPALAQGTTEQREACTPDAIKLCSDTIPDIPKTTACMERHRAELTPKCRAVMNSESPAPTRADKPSATRKHAAREAPAAEDDQPPRPRDADLKKRRAARDLRRDDDAGPDDDRRGYERPDAPDERRAARDDGPDRYGYGPRGDGGPPEGPPPGYGPRGYGARDGDRADEDGPPPGYIPPGERRYRYLTPNGDPAVTPEGGGRARARAEISRLCADDMIDPRTCAETERALRR